MNQAESSSDISSLPKDCLAEASRTGALILSTDWSRTSVGRMESWSPTLRMMVRVVLANRLKMVSFWGSEFCQIYNDSFSLALGTKHPGALGKPASECWVENWNTFGPALHKIFNGGDATSTYHLTLGGNAESASVEPQLTISLSPIPDETVPSGIGGILGVVSDNDRDMLRNPETPMEQQQGPEESANPVGFTSAVRMKAITGRKRAEEEVSKLAALVENSSDFIGMATPEGHVLFVNPAGCALLGLEGKNYVRKTSIFDYVMEKDRPLVENEILPAVREKGAWHGEVRFRHFQTGATIPMLSNVFLIKEHGTARPLALATISRDITERTQAERASRASEERFRSYFELGLIGMAMTSPAKGCLEVNDELCRMLGYERNELLQKNWVELTHPDDLAADILNFDRVMAGEIDGYSLDKRFIRQDGQVVHSIMSAKCLRLPDGSVDYFVGLLLDTTERRRAEEKLRRSEANLAEGQRLSHTGSWSWIVSSHELYCSQEVLRIFGLDPAADSCHEALLQMIHPEDQARVRQIFDRAVHSSADYEAEYRIIRPDGSIRHITNLASPCFDPSGRLIEYVGTLMDVTERKHAEEALHKLQVELAHVTRMTTLGELAASIAHEINQPLGAIVNNGNACLRLMAEESGSHVRLRECISDMVSDAMRTGMVINRVRALARRSPPEQTFLQLENVVADVLALATHELTERRISLRTEFANDLPNVFGDRVQLQQMFLNLVMNASEAMSDMPEDRRSLLITGSRGSLLGQSAVLMTVVDLGPGFNSEDSERLFDAFYTTKLHGMGMGLRISRSIAEAHRGRLWAKPNEGPGATFWLALPVEENP